MNIPVLDPAQALAWTEARVREAVDGPDEAPPRGISWTLWRADRPTLCLGLSQRAGREARLDACRADGVAVLRRASGGGAVVLTDGTLCWEAWAPETALGAEAGIRTAYRALSRAVVDGLAALGVSTAAAGTSDLAWIGTPGAAPRKVAGTAQFRAHGRVWVHGSLLVDCKVTAFDRWLQAPSEAPAYRAGRDHRAFCVTLEEIRGRPTPIGETAAAIARAASELGWRFSVPDASCPRAAAIYREKYGRAAWNEHADRSGAPQGR